MPKKLLIVTDEMEVGGTQRQIVELGRSIDRSAFDISVVYFRSGSRHVDELRELGIDVFRIPRRGKLDLLFFFELCQHIRRHDYDVIHAFSFSGELWSWLANSVAGSARFVGSIRSVYEWYSPWQWAVKGLITRNSAALVANSRAGAEHAALHMGLRRQTVDVVHNCIRLPPEHVLDRTNADSGETEKGIRVLFVGRLVKHKNIECLLHAFLIVLRAIPDAKLEIVGDGPQRSAIEGLIVELDLGGHVTLFGEQTDVPRFLRECDVFVSTSYREGLSNAIMEAMSYGRPVVASNVGGNSELIEHDRSGMLFPADDHESLAAMLIELNRNPEKRAELGINARNAMTRCHDARRMAAEMERIYERCLVEDKAFVLGR